METQDTLDTLIRTEQPRALSRRTRATVERRVHAHLTRIADPDLTNDVRTLLHLLNVEAARLRHHARDTTEPGRP